MRALVAGAIAGVLVAGAPYAYAQDRPAPGAETAPDLAPYDGRLVAEVRLEGLEHVSPQFARNQLRTREGRQFRALTVTEDIQRLHRTGSFSRVNASVELLADGSVAVVHRASVDGSLTRCVSSTRRSQAKRDDPRGGEQVKKAASFHSEP